MNFTDTKTNRIIKLEELKEGYTQAKKNSKSKYINFQEYLDGPYKQVQNY